MLRARFAESIATRQEAIEVAGAAALARTFGAFLAGNAAFSLYHLGRRDSGRVGGGPPPRPAQPAAGAVTPRPPSRSA